MDNVYSLNLYGGDSDNDDDDHDDDDYTNSNDDTKMERTTVFDKISTFLAVELIIPSQSMCAIRH